jgi:hypothetical protein
MWMDASLYKGYNAQQGRSLGLDNTATIIAMDYAACLACHVSFLDVVVACICPLVILLRCTTDARCVGRSSASSSLFLQHGTVQSVNQHPRSNAITARFPAEAKRAESKEAPGVLYVPFVASKIRPPPPQKDAHAQFKQLEEPLLHFDASRCTWADDRCTSAWTTTAALCGDDYWPNCTW